MNQRWGKGGMKVVWGGTSVEKQRDKRDQFYVDRLLIITLTCSCPAPDQCSLSHRLTMVHFKVFS